MRLYLSSFDVGRQPAELLSLARGAHRIGIIANALDNRPEARAKWLSRQEVQFRDMGFDVRELDLRDYFGRSDPLARSLSAIDIVWITGGNAFILRRAMKQSGFDLVMQAALSKDEIVYAGFSAAAVVCSNSLHGLEIIDDPHDVPPGYDRAVVWEGLGLLPFALVVHYDSDHPESASASEEAAYYKSRGIPYRTLRDGEVLIVDGSVQRVT